MRRETINQSLSPKSPKIGNQQMTSQHFTFSTNNGTGTGPSGKLNISPPILNSDVLQRRESLVKPTWQNVVPGQVPSSTLQNINGYGNGYQQVHISSNKQTKQQPAIPMQQVHQQNLVDNMVIATQNPEFEDPINSNGMNSMIDGNQMMPGSPRLSLKNNRKQVELYDIFGKVKILHNPFVWLMYLF